MKIRLPGVLILVSSFLYLISSIFRLVYGFGFEPISMLIALISIGILAVAGLLASNKNMLLILVGAYFALNLFDVLFFDWFRSNLLIGFITNFLPLNYLLVNGAFYALVQDLHLLVLFAGIVLTFVMKEPLGSTGSRPTQAQPPQRSFQRPTSNIEGDAVVQVQKLGELLKQGLITEEEFQFKKKQILGL
jgi:hypothetical protein